MAFLDDLTQKAAKLAEQGVKKGGELAEEGKIKVQILAKENDLTAIYKELGKQYYAILKEGNVPDEARELVAKAIDLEKAIADLKSQEK